MNHITDNIEQQEPQKQQYRQSNISSSSFFPTWWNKLVAIVALINLLLVLFNLSYIPLRDVYLRNSPFLVSFYDPVKSIEPHPYTERYIRTVDLLKQQIPEIETEAALTTKLLENLREQSTNLLIEDPFLSANKFGTFAKLKRRMQYHMDTLSAKQAFDRFWRTEYLQNVGFDSELSFFERKIKPLLAANYYRNVDENGQFIDNFWRIDIYFIIFFICEFFIRTFSIARKRDDVSWWDVILRNWYEGFLFLPFWRWLRIVPTSVKLHKSGLVDLEQTLAQVTHEPAAYLANRASIFLMVQLINQTQDAIASGEVTRALFKKDRIEVNQVDELDIIIDRLLQLSIYKVLPQVQPNLEDLLRHSLRKTLKSSNFYQALPEGLGIKMIPMDLTEQIADSLTQTVYEVLAASYADTETRKLVDESIKNFQQALREELQNEKIQSELLPLLVDLLEELKLNYVQRSVKQDPTSTLAEAEEIRQNS